MGKFEIGDVVYLAHYPDNPGIVLDDLGQDTGGVLTASYHRYRIGWLNEQMNNEINGVSLDLFSDMIDDKKKELEKNKKNLDELKNKYQNVKMKVKIPPIW